MLDYDEVSLGEASSQLRLLLMMTFVRLRAVPVACTRNMYQLL